MKTNAITTRVDEIVAALRADTGELDFDPQMARVFIQVLRTLARGTPVSPLQVTQIAKDFDLPDGQANATLDWLAEKNENGDIVGLAGLSLNEWSHKYKVNGQELSTWCALDTLYLTPLLKQATEVESLDPVTQERIKISLSPEGVLEYLPKSAVLSIVIPKVDVKGLQSAEQIWTAFCNYSLFFTTVETARQWFRGKKVEPVLLSIKEGFELGRKWFEKVRKYA
jgi:alkylmercury lyase